MHLGRVLARTAARAQVPESSPPPGRSWFLVMSHTLGHHEVEAQAVGRDGLRLDAAVVPGVDLEKDAEGVEVVRRLLGAGLVESQVSLRSCVERPASSNWPSSMESCSVSPEAASTNPWGNHDDPERVTLAYIGGPVYMLHVMTLRSLAAALLILGSAVPYTAPMLCTVLGPHHASQMESCPGQSAPMTGADHHGCDLAQCATPSIAAPLIPLRISLGLSIVDLAQPHATDDFAGDVRPPLTPPPIA
jgi:hypothetical protein